MELKKGMTVYLIPNRHGNAFRGEYAVEPHVIERVGREYFYLEEQPRLRYSISGMCSVDGNTFDYDVFLTEQAAYDFIEREHLLVTLRGMDYDHLSLPQLRAVKQIMDGDLTMYGVTASGEVMSWTEGVFSDRLTLGAYMRKEGATYDHETGCYHSADGKIVYTVDKITLNRGDGS